MKKCVYCGKELDDSTKVCPRCKERQDEHKSTEDMYEDAYNEFYKNFYKKIENNDDVCNTFETEDYHDKHQKNKKSKRRQELEERLQRKRNKRINQKKPRGCLSKLFIGIIIYILFQFGVIGIIGGYIFPEEYDKHSEEATVEFGSQEALDYYYGENGKEVDYQKAYELLDGRATTAEEKYIMADILLFNRVELDKTESEMEKLGAKYLQESAYDNYKFAILRVGLAHLDGLYGYEKDVPKAIDKLENAASEIPVAYYYLGYIYDNATEFEGIEPSSMGNEEQAIAYYEEGVEEGDPYCQTELAYKYIYDTEIVGEDIDKALELFEAASEQGDEYANYHLGLLYYEGEYVSKDFKKAVRYLKLAREGALSEEDIETINEILERIDN